MNHFCASLAPGDRAILCTQCSQRNVPRGSMLFKEEMAASIYIVLRGFLVTDVPFDEEEYFKGRYPGLGIIVADDVFSCDLVCSPVEAEAYPYFRKHAHGSSEAYTPTLLGRVPLSTVRQLFDRSTHFAHRLFQRNIEMFGRTCEFASAVRTGDAQKSIRYVLCFAASHGLDLTHQQIAQLLRRNRTTVSKMLAALPREDPAFCDALEQLKTRALSSKGIVA